MLGACSAALALHRSGLEVEPHAEGDHRCCLPTVLASVFGWVPWEEVFGPVPCAWQSDWQLHVERFFKAMFSWAIEGSASSLSHDTFFLHSGGQHWEGAEKGKKLPKWDINRNHEVEVIASSWRPSPILGWRP